MMRYTFILAIICVIGISIVSAEPTARTYIFAAMESNFNDELIDSLAKYFDVVITHEGQREYNPMFRDSNEVVWRRNKPPWVLLYKDAMTLIGPVVDTITGDTSYWGDKSIGGGASVGGFWHYDSVFFGYGALMQYGGVDGQWIMAKPTGKVFMDVVQRCSVYEITRILPMITPILMASSWIIYCSM
jgi:hypothetical protein